MMGEFVLQGRSHGLFPQLLNLEVQRLANYRVELSREPDNRPSIPGEGKRELRLLSREARLSSLWGRPADAQQSPWCAGRPPATSTPRGEFGANLLRLYTQPELSQSDTYRPGTAFGYEVYEDRVRTIAVLSDPIAVQDLKDIPLLRDDIGEDLARRVIWKLENATINGDAETDTESFEGILHMTGVLDQTYTVSPARTIRKALTRLETSGHDPAQLAIAMHPDVWEDIETAEDAEGRPLYPNLYTARQEPILYGRKVILTDKLSDASAVVANWGYGGLTIRDHIKLAWSDGGDRFETNTVRFRAEMRAGFNLVQPGAFIHAALQA